MGKYQVTINSQRTELFADFGGAMEYAKSVGSSYVFIVAPYGGGICALKDGVMCLGKA